MSHSGTGSPDTRLPLNFLAIPFGLCGIAGTWTIAAQALTVSPTIGLGLWAIAALSWLTVLVVYFRRARKTSGTLLADLKHPFLGPFASLAPVVAILIGGSMAHLWPVVATGLVTVGVITIGILSAWLLSGWMTGAIDAHIFHPGNFLSVLAGGLIGAIGLAEVGAHALALIAFGIGIFFWAVLAAVVVARLAAAQSLPPALVPTLAIFSVPPSVAGIAWFAINGESIDPIHQILLGLMLFLLLGQLFLVPRYARVPFGIGYWSFTFSAAAPATYGIHWLWVTQPAGWAAWSWLILIAVTLWIGWIAMRSAWQARRRARESASPVHL
ncbi:SLAC1 family transporter [Parafrigoribacterium humi]|uniref:SLAC1 family transporter n=1 Tax=Parafrigoribacterium humi TaxID=3144664 RepID=UPI0032ED26D6